MLIDMEDLTAKAQTWLRLDKVGLALPPRLSPSLRYPFNTAKDPETRFEMESLLADRDFTELRNRLGTSQYQLDTCVSGCKRWLTEDRAGFWNRWPQGKDGSRPITPE